MIRSLPTLEPPWRRCYDTKAYWTTTAKSTEKPPGTTSLSGPRALSGMPRIPSIDPGTCIICKALLHRPLPGCSAPPCLGLRSSVS
jgi:hypothetical protein